MYICIYIYSMLTVEQGLEIMAPAVIKNKVHRDYNHTVKLSELYHILITGENSDVLLRRFNLRETEEMFEQRKRLTQLVVSSVSWQIMATFNKVGRVKPSVDLIDWEQSENGNEEKKRRLQSALDNYHSEKSIDAYLFDNFKNLTFTDPNAFIVTEFKPFDNNTETAQPYPFEVSSKEAIDYKYVNGVLQYLLIKQRSEFKVGDQQKKGFNYTLYLGDYIISWVQVPTDTIISNPATTGKASPESTYFRADSDRLFQQTIYNPKAGEVQAIRVGYIKDLVTDGRTCVNPFHCALPYYMKSVKAVSETDLTHSLHAFPRLTEYRDACRVSGVTKICETSQVAQKDCKLCGGTGYKTQTTAQDSLVVKMPADPKDIIEIGKLTQYTYVPVELVKYMDEYVIQLKNDVYRTLFNAEITTKSEVATTAFEKNIEMQNVYDTLYPFGEKVCEFYMKAVKFVATFLDLGNGIIVRRKYNKDFKFKTVEMLLLELKTANEAGTSSYIRQEINMNIAEQMYIDEPLKFIRFQVKNLFFPFKGKSESEINLILAASGLCTQRDKVLYANFDSIFEELEAESITSGSGWYYELPYEEQKTLLNEKLTAKILEIRAESTTAFEYASPDNEEEEPAAE